MLDCARRRYSSTVAPQMGGKRPKGIGMSRPNKKKVAKLTPASDAAKTTSRVKWKRPSPSPSAEPEPTATSSSPMAASPPASDGEMPT